MQLLVFTEAGFNFGLGHLIRCLSIAQAFKDKGINSKFYINGDKNTARFLSGFEHKIENWYTSFNKISETRIFKNSICLIDSYHADFELYNIASNQSRLLLVIDDTNRLNYPKSLVVNGSIGATDLNYLGKNENTYLLGTKYQAIRKEFWDIKPIRINKEIKNIFITFGATDLRQLSSKVAKTIGEYCKSNLILLMGSNSRSDEIINQSNIQLVNELKSAELIRLLNKTDLAISAVGQSTYEFAKMGIPTIGIQIADNQSTNVNGWINANYISFIGSWDKYNENDLLREISILNDSETRKLRSSIGFKLVDGQGARRIFDECNKRVL